MFHIHKTKFIFTDSLSLSLYLSLSLSLSPLSPSLLLFLLSACSVYFSFYCFFILRPAVASGFVVVYRNSLKCTHNITHTPQTHTPHIQIYTHTTHTHTLHTHTHRTALACLHTKLNFVLFLFFFFNFFFIWFCGIFFLTARSAEPQCPCCSLPLPTALLPSFAAGQLGLFRVLVGTFKRSSQRVSSGPNMHVKMQRGSACQRGKTGKRRGVERRREGRGVASAEGKPRYVG